MASSNTSPNSRPRSSRPGSAAWQRPFQHLVEHLRPGVIRPPPLHQAGIEVHDPVFANPRSLIDAPLGSAILWCGGRGKDLDGEERHVGILPARQGDARDAPQHEEVGLHQCPGTEPDIRRRRECLRVVAMGERLYQVAPQQSQSALMQERRRRSHDVHAIQQLVPQAVVGQGQKLLDGRDRRIRDWHGHKVGRLGG
ncbi:MAG TPA: hypothetical protein VH879_07750 [Gemmatimonadales bacterium]